MSKELDFSKLEIELVTNIEDREYYNDQIVRHHYLKSSPMTRNSIIHVILIDGEVVAILTWERSRKTKFNLRDEIFKWSDSTKRINLKYVIENVRFLVLVNQDNLASKSLSMSVNRLRTDCILTFGHPCFVAETFVDPNHNNNQGICYRAANWSNHGLTAGGHGGTHGNRSRKMYFTKEIIYKGIEKTASEVKVNSVKFTKDKKVNSILESLNLKNLQAKLESIPDWRNTKIKYGATQMLTLILISILCGATTCSDITRWIGKLSLEHLASYGMQKAPCNTTVWRCLSSVKDEVLSKVLISWIKENCLEHKIGQLHYIFDGKHLKTASKKEEQSKIMIANIIEATSKVVVMQQQINEKTNEIPVLQAALEEGVIPDNSILTVDALHLQRKTLAVAQKKILRSSVLSKIIRENY